MTIPEREIEITGCRDGDGCLFHRQHRVSDQFCGLYQCKLSPEDSLQIAGRKRQKPGFCRVTKIKLVGDLDDCFNSTGSGW